MLRKIALFTAVTAFSVSSVYAGVDEAKKWIDEEFQPSTLSKDCHDSYPCSKPGYDGFLLGRLFHPLHPVSFPPFPSKHCAPPGMSKR